MNILNGINSNADANSQLSQCHFQYATLN